MQKRASFPGWQTTADMVLAAEFKLRFRVAGPRGGAGLMRDVGQEGVARRATCLRGAGVFVSDHTDHGLGEQQASQPSDKTIALDLNIEIMCRVVSKFYFRLCLARAQEKRLQSSAKSEAGTGGM